MSDGRSANISDAADAQEFGDAVKRETSPSRSIGFRSFAGRMPAIQSVGISGNMFAQGSGFHMHEFDSLLSKANYPNRWRRQLCRITIMMDAFLVQCCGLAFHHIAISRAKNDDCIQYLFGLAHYHFPDTGARQLNVQNIAIEILLFVWGASRDG